MKKIIIFILFTFISFISFSKDIYAASNCWECYNRYNYRNEVNYYWSDGNPTETGKIKETAIFCEVKAFDEKTCKSMTDTYHGNDADDMEENYLENNASCYELGKKGTYILFWGTNPEADNYKNNNGYTSKTQRNIQQAQCYGEYTSQTQIDKIEQDNISGSGGTSSGEGGLPNVGFGQEDMSCSEMLGPSLTKLVNILIDVFKFAAVAICIVKMMMTMLPPITSKDSDALNKAIRTCVTLLIICAAALLIDTFVVIIGRLFGFDLSCFR